MSQARLHGRRLALALRVAMGVGLLGVIVSSVPAASSRLGLALPIVLWICLAVFLLHWIAALLAARERRGIGAWLRSLSGLIDTLCVVAVPAAFLTGVREPWLAGSVWVLQLISAFPSLGHLGRVFAVEARALSGVAALFVMVLVLAATAMHVIEGPGQPADFGTLPGALWWAVVTLTTTGYGEVVPHSDAGRLLASVVMIIGLCLFGLVTGILATGFDAEGRRQDFLRSWELVSGLPLFGTLSRPAVAALAHALRRWDVGTNTVITRRGRPGESMFFVVAGEVEVDLDQPVRIGPGGFFGEQALLGQGVRNATVSTTCATTLLVLDIADFRVLTAQHPELAAAVEAEARRRGGA